MSYDNYGNITAKNGIAYTYEGTWKDLLIAYNGQSITYDAQGNPTTYLGHTLTWEKGRQLKSYDTNTYTYNANGIRTSKTVGGVKHTYILDGAKILRETWGDNVLSTLWDNDDSLCGIRYADESYFFLKNLQGDIIAITDKDGTVVARYSYYAWGVCTIVSDTTTVGIATINPFRYRGYYYDSETQLYYLQSRYYNPTVGRFVNVDEVIFSTVLPTCITDHNTYCYVRNNALSHVDANGYSAALAYTISSTAAYGIGTIAAAGTTLLASLQAFLAMLWNIFVVVGLLVLVIAAVVVLCKSIEKIHSDIKRKVKVKSDKYNDFDGQICIYVLARKPNDMHSIFYVGRTQHIKARHAHHKSHKGKYGSFEMYVIYTCKNVAMSRIVEQSVLAACMVDNSTSIIFGTAPSNKIRGVANSKSAINNVINSYKKTGGDMSDLLSLLGCTAESDVLYLLEKTLS